MKLAPTTADQRKERIVNAVALGMLLALGALALVGPYGVLAWSEQASLLEQRNGQIELLLAEKAELANRNALLDPENVDPDLSSELVRSNLNVAHPDEYVYELSEQP